MKIKQQDLGAALACMQVTQDIILDVIEELLEEIPSGEADFSQVHVDVAKEMMSFLINMDCFSRLYKEIKDEKLIRVLEGTSIELKKRFKDYKETARGLGVECHEIRTETANDN